MFYTTSVVLKKDTRVVDGEELKDATLNDISLNMPRQPISEQATSRAGNRIRDNLFNSWDKNLKRISLYICIKH